MGWRRLGGRGTTVDGDAVVWSVAEGTRGTRWREIVARGDHVLHAIMAEVAPSGRLTRLEIAASSGLLTLHPERGERAMHGNVVTPDGVVHVSLPWDEAALLLVVASPTVMSVALQGAASRIGIGERGVTLAVYVGDDLRPVAGSWSIERLSTLTWRLQAGDEGSAWAGSVGAEPGPMLTEATNWPLERD